MRLLMLLIIAGAFPFYCLAIYIIGIQPIDGAAPAITEAASPAPSFTPLGADRVMTATATISRPMDATNTPLSILRPTPIQFLPPTPIPPQTIVAQTIVSPSPIIPEASPTPAATAGEETLDGDFDGIADAVDRCPAQYGYADNAGCPYPDDGDRDGIRDAQDACPSEFAPGSRRGCRDFDDDGLDTAEDGCPLAAGPSSNQGCPLAAVAGG